VRPVVEELAEVRAPILAATAWATNADLIVAARGLGYLRDDADLLDPTYGRGTFWKLWTPSHLVKHDLKLDGVDFRNLPYADGTFHQVVFDPPYKLNGTPTENVDERYGVNVVGTRAGRMQLCLDGIEECARVTALGGWLLVKCQDQVNGGQVRWQTRTFSDHAESFGFRLVDMLLKLGGRPQPDGRRQVHARRNYSTMLVLKRERP
jgi:hypothetical protein